jgi:hypothetical protein
MHEHQYFVCSGGPGRAAVDELLPQQQQQQQQQQAGYCGAMRCASVLVLWHDRYQYWLVLVACVRRSVSGQHSPQGGVVVSEVSAQRPAHHPGSPLSCIPSGPGFRGRWLEACALDTAPLTAVSKHHKGVTFQGIWGSLRHPAGPLLQAPWGPLDVAPGSRSAWGAKLPPATLCGAQQESQALAPCVRREWVPSFVCYWRAAGYD